ncbi:VOC family protein [Alteraurantiacibacter aestuarii]|uniref:VOC family protein n=1 Tax=Alteraurantiacibacter aestuarii TaxID=650004 RepID=A0A844ZHG4_9SPHN|nr:VOC family protein [Alteraurantiacibacter aestuarii]MXO87275.1 VOC family protein [Alteraurantiacibacter aestuarii]
MYSHHMIGTNDLARAKAFYDATFTALGGSEGMLDEVKGRVAYRHNGGVFIVTRPRNGEPATAANGSTIGFAVDTPEQADAWHAAGVVAGGTAIEDPPGVRDLGDRKLYLAYLRDPDGHKLCVLKQVD